MQLESEEGEEGDDEEEEPSGKKKKIINPKIIRLKVSGVKIFVFRVWFYFHYLREHKIASVYTTNNFSNNLEAYLEPCQKSKMELFAN